MGEDDDAETADRPANQNMESVTRKIQIKTKGKVFAVVRESYLRQDIPCLSELCFEDCSHATTERSAQAATIPASSVLPADLTHYLIPFTDVVAKYMEVLEGGDFTGLIFPQTVVNTIQQKSLKHYRRLCSYIRDPKRCSVFFPNEFFQPTFVHREEGETLPGWQSRMIYQVGLWYYEHLGGQKPIVLVSEDESVLSAFANLRIEVFVLSLAEYLEKFWSHLTSVQEVYKTLAALQRDGGEEAGPEVKEYTEYYRPEVLAAGMRAGKLVAGLLAVNKHLGQLEAFVTPGQAKDISEKSSGSGSRDILISGTAARNRAVHGDRVVVELLPKSEWQSKETGLVQEEEEKDEGRSWSRGADVMPTGRVVGVLERNWRDYIATVPSQDEDTLERAAGKRILVYPFDRRIPKIRILTSQRKQLQGNRILVRIDGWPVSSQYPQGHFVKLLGRIGHLETEIDSILVENSIEVTPFSQGILQELPCLEAAKTWRPDEKELLKRRDFRSSMVMSIDPKGCEDVDDAISINRLDNGNLEIGVHIADVTQFVRFNSLTDLEARKRATTVYLADRRYDMLPSVLSAQLCSLLGGVERYAVSVTWELHPTTFKVRRVWYGRSVIRSAYKLCYEDAQDIIDGSKSLSELQASIPELQGLTPALAKDRLTELKANLQLLTQVASSWQAGREAKGALNLESTEVQFEFEEQSLQNIRPKAHLVIHETVAEYMIMANHWVARKIAETFPTQALLRLHPPPKKENFEELRRCAGSRGWEVDVRSNKALAASLDTCKDDQDPNVNFLLKSLATYAMVQAEYFSTGSVANESWHHYGLALDRYTHFTSPIRRYADIVVHRLLLAALEKSDWWAGGEVSTHLFNNTLLQELCQHINTRNRAAQLAQRTSAQLFQTLFFKDRPLSDPKCIVDAVVYSLRSNGFIVYIPAYSIKGPVYLENREREVLYNTRHGLVWQKGVVTQRDHFVKVETIEGEDVYRIFDHVTVGIQLKGSEAHGYSLSLILLDKQGHFTPPATPAKSPVVDFHSEVRANITQQEESDKDEEEMEGDATVPRNSKNKLNPFRFFQDMRLVGQTLPPPPSSSPQL